MARHCVGAVSRVSRSYSIDLLFGPAANFPVKTRSTTGGKTVFPTEHTQAHEEQDVRDELTDDEDGTEGGADSDDSDTSEVSDDSIAENPCQDIKVCTGSVSSLIVI